MNNIINKVLNYEFDPESFVIVFNLCLIVALIALVVKIAP